jgi:uncharacterized protein (TIGR02145 family)
LYSADALNSQNSQNAQTAGNGISGVSLTGDTLFLANGNFVIVPGISDANGPVEIFGCTSNSACNYNSAASIDDGSCYFVGSACDDADNNTYGDAFNSDCVCIGIPGGGGIGALVLPGNVTCADEYISVSGCNGETSITYDGRDYDLVEIGGQCWFAENLATSHYRNGDAISTGLSNADWENTDITQQGAYVVYDNDINNDLIYGKLYNWYAVTDPRGLCPSGWHVPSDCEWMYLEGSLGLSVEEQQSINFRGVQVGGSMKTTGTIESGSGLWLSPNLGATNSSGFSAIPSGYIGANGATFYLKGNSGFWWSRTPTAIGNTTAAIVRVLSRNLSSINRSTNFGTQPGTAVRCVRD